MVDYFQAESLLSEQEISYRDGVRKFVHEECMPVIVEHFDRWSFPMELIPRMAELGLFGLHVDGYGCKKASHTIYSLVCQEMGRCNSGLRAMVTAICPPQTEHSDPSNATRIVEYITPPSKRAQI